MIADAGAALIAHTSNAATKASHPACRPVIHLPTITSTPQISNAPKGIAAPAKVYPSTPEL